MVPQILLGRAVPAMGRSTKSACTRTAVGFPSEQLASVMGSEVDRGTLSVRMKIELYYRAPILFRIHK
jgi:hypothetical protein